MVSHNHNQFYYFKSQVKMKKLYTLTLCALSVLTFSASAQTGGTYTAHLAGDWHSTTSSIWLPTEPPALCNNCLISLQVAGQVNLNTHVTLTGNSQLIIGDAGNATTLFIANSGATDSAHSYSINLVNDGTNSIIKLVSNNDFVTIANNIGHAGDYDGLFTSFVASGVVSAFKQVGFAPNGFVNDVQASSAAPANAGLSGPVTLSATGTLPILLMDFNAILNDGAADLTWTTALEINSDHFTIQRSTDAGATWTNIGTVAAHGNSSTAINYSFTDNKIPQGTSEYRLQMVDKDGKFAYSEVRSIRVGIVTSVSVYPNPAHDYVNVTLAGSSTEGMVIRLFNQSGQVLLEKNVSNAGGTTIPLAVSNYPEGNYIVVVTAADGSRQVNKLVITK